MSMSLFNLYLDDDTKFEAAQKLVDLGLQTTKGSISALIRVLMRDFVDMEEEQAKQIVAKVENEYTYTTKKNKRSRL